MIKSKRELAITLGSRSVDKKEIGKKLERVVALWISRKEVIESNGRIVLV